MKLCYVTDSLGHLSFEEMLDEAASLGIQSLEFTTGNWSNAPHLQIDELLKSKVQRKEFMKAIHERGLELETLNCSGNQLNPSEKGVRHQEVVEKTFQLAELYGIKKIVMMSGLPGAGPNAESPNWITTSWPPENVEILEWQWNEVGIPYWEKTVQLAERHGIEKIALENHGCQLVYNPETLFRLRNHVGTLIGMNFDPSHLMWMNGDPISAVRALDEAIYHVHAKDVRVEKDMNNINGILDTKTIDSFGRRTWNYVALGYGHDIGWWKQFFAVLKMTGYDGPISLEMEDLTMDPQIGVKKSIEVIKQALPEL